MIIIKRVVNPCDSIYSVYSQISNILEKENIIKNGDMLKRILLERQNMGEIQILPNFYLPHIRTKEVSELIVINAEGFKQNKVLFLLVPDRDFYKYRDMAISIVMKIEDDKFIKSMENSEEVFKDYIISLVADKVV